MLGLWTLDTGPFREAKSVRDATAGVARGGESRVEPLCGPAGPPCTRGARKVACGAHHRHDRIFKA